MRDFILMALTGGVCGVLGQAWLTAAALLSIALLLAVFHYQVKTRTGITTEMAAVAAFALGYLTATPGLPTGRTARDRRHHRRGGVPGSQGLACTNWCARPSPSANSTTRCGFLAVVLVIFPVLPEGQFGPYGFFEPRKIWLFVILVSSISYIGYFLEKFMGTAKSLRFTSILGGLASTTAATAAFARSAADEPRKVQRSTRRRR